MLYLTQWALFSWCYLTMPSVLVKLCRGPNILLALLACRCGAVALIAIHAEWPQDRHQAVWLQAWEGNCIKCHSSISMGLHCLCGKVCKKAPSKTYDTCGHKGKVIWCSVSFSSTTTKSCLHLQDLPGALSDAQVAEGLGLTDIKNRDWSIFKTSAIKGTGLFEGLDWLSNMLKSRRQ